MTKPRKTYVRTLAEFNAIIAKAEREGHPPEEIKISHKLVPSEDEAKKIYTRAWEQGIPQKGRPSFVQPESPGQQLKQ